VPFGKVYEWHSACVTVECGCGEKLTVDATGISTTCRCGADLGAFVRALEEPREPPPGRITHPWFYDADARALQGLRDEAAYPGSSPWRYDDITEDGR
jgi:hypothetical protein